MMESTTLEQTNPAPTSKVDVVLSKAALESVGYGSEVSRVRVGFDSGFRCCDAGVVGEEVGREDAGPTVDLVMTLRHAEKGLEGGKPGPRVARAESKCIVCEKTFHFTRNCSKGFC